MQDELLRTRMALEDAETARRQAVAGRMEAEAESQQLNDELETLRRYLIDRIVDGEPD